MMQETDGGAFAGNGSSGKLAALFLLFVASGCAALIYEVVWFQMLGVVIGSSAVSLGILLGTYMGGMCLGSLLLPRLVSAGHHPLKVYAWLEIGIGVFGLLVLALLPQVTQVYVAGVGHGMGSIFLRAVVCAICLLPSTFLMGATLPAISRWLETTPRGVSWLGFFYGGNIAGAVFGCLLAGFYLLRVHDGMVATYVAVTLNFAVAAIAFLLARGTKARVAETTGSTATPGRRGAVAVYVVIAISGICALGSEVIWTRMLSLLLGGTVYTFSIILSVFLVGLGIGSSVGSVIARETSRPGLALAICQFLAALSMGWTAYMLSRSVPFWPVNPALTASPWLNFQMDLARCLWATLPAPILWGASFPLALAAVARPGQDPGGVVGKVYAANTVGAILGALGASVLLVGWFGTQRAQQWLMILAGLGTLMMMVVAFRTDPQPLLRVKTMRVIGATGAVALVLAAAGAVPSLPWKLVAFGRYLPTYTDDRLVLFLGEGLVSSVAVTEMQDGVRTFHVSGKVEASSDAQDMRLQRMLGHIPALLHPNPKSVLIVGCGAGVTAGSFTVYPGIERIVICEIEPLIPRHVAPYFGPENYNVVNDPRVEIIHDDARHYILTTKEKFDIITSDPIHPWVKGAATLYTKEYFEMVKKHLKPGGLVTQWVPLYESNLDVVKSEIATFFSVFEDGTIWSNDNQGQGYDTVLLGSAEPISIDLDAIQARMEQTSAVAESLQDVGFWSAMALMATHAGQAADLKQWLADAEINRDRNLRLQFMAGLASTVFQEGTIYDEIISQWGFPDGLFTGPEEAVRELREALERRRGKR